MKKDTKKICYAHGGKGGSGKQGIRQNRHEAKQDPENAESYQGMKRVHTKNGWGCIKERYPSSNYITKFLKKHLGKKWDIVYSDICANIDDHLIRESIRYTVHFNIYYNTNGQPVATDHGHPQVLDGYWDAFYIEPGTNILRLVKRKQVKYQRTNPFADIRVLNKTNDLIQYWKIRGIWYEIIFRRPTNDEVIQRSFGKWEYDSTGRGRWGKKYENYIISDLRLGFAHVGNELWSAALTLFNAHIFPTKKRQLSSKEIKQLCL
jgi:hypothetical protein